jgi:hypothetical protein
VRLVAGRFQRGMKLKVENTGNDRLHTPTSSSPRTAPSRTKPSRAMRSASRTTALAHRRHADGRRETLNFVACRASRRNHPPRA